MQRSIQHESTYRSCTVVQVEITAWKTQPRLRDLHVRVCEGESEKHVYVHRTMYMPSKLQQYNIENEIMPLISKSSIDIHKVHTMYNVYAHVQVNNYLLGFA